MKKLIVLLILVLSLTACTNTTKYTPQLLQGEDIINVGSQHTDSGCIVLIEEETHILDVVSNNVNTTALGEYLISYEKTIDDVLYECKRFVKVVDNESPYVRLEPGVDTIFVGETHVDAGILATDNTDDDIDIDVISDVDTSTAGTYQIKYIATDDYNNVTIIIRTVTVLENE